MWDGGPVWGPDGRRVIFSSERFDAEPDQIVPPTLALTNLDGSADEQEFLLLPGNQRGQMMVVESKSEDTFDPIAAKPLFEKPDVVSKMVTARIGTSYDVDKEGRLLMIEWDPNEKTTKVHVVINWAAGIQSKGE